MNLNILLQRNNKDWKPTPRERGISYQGVSGFMFLPHGLVQLFNNLLCDVIVVHRMGKNPSYCVTEHRKGWFSRYCFGVYWTPECLLNVWSVYTCSKYCRRDQSMSGNVAWGRRESLHVWNGGTTHGSFGPQHKCYEDIQKRATLGVVCGGPGT